MADFVGKIIRRIKFYGYALKEMAKVLSDGNIDAMEEKNHDNQRFKTEREKRESDGGVSDPARGQRTSSQSGRGPGFQRTARVVRKSGRGVHSYKIEQLLAFLHGQSEDDASNARYYRALMFVLTEFVNEWQCLTCGNMEKLPQDYENPTHCFECGGDRCWPRDMQESDRMAAQLRILTNALGDLVSQHKITHDDYAKILDQCANWRQ